MTIEKNDTRRLENPTEFGPAEPPRGRRRAELREGFTTGSAATAAAMAALDALLRGDSVACAAVPPASASASGGGSGAALPVAGPESEAAPYATSEVEAHPASAYVLGLAPDAALPEAAPESEAAPYAAVWSIPLPPDEAGRAAGRLDIPVCGVRVAGGEAIGSVIKDGGDDPDATHGALVQAAVSLVGNCPAGTLILEGGRGVGRVTLPGLSVPVGEAAINPGPRAQMACGIREVAAAHAYAGGVRVVIAVPDGEAIARHTLNPRLGIVGGISILGTRGTVRPYSHDAWKAAVAQELDVACAVGVRMVCLSTGRRSETLLMRQYADLPPQAFVQAADFAAFSLEAAANVGFTHVAWGCFFGKLVKLAQGLPHTHARTAPLDLALLARWCAEAGVASVLVEAIAEANTAGQALDILNHDPARDAVLDFVARRAKAVAEGFAGGRLTVTMHLFHLNGMELITV